MNIAYIKKRVFYKVKHYTFECFFLDNIMTAKFRKVHFLSFFQDLHKMTLLTYLDINY